MITLAIAAIGQERVGSDIILPWANKGRGLIIPSADIAILEAHEGMKW